MVWYVIGVMSGTSLDGIDLTYVKIEKKKTYSFDILESNTVNYSEKWKKSIIRSF